MEIYNLVELNEDKIISTVNSKLTKYTTITNIFEQSTLEPSEEPTERPSNNNPISTNCPSVNYQIKNYSKSKNKIIKNEELACIVIFPLLFVILLVFYLFYRKNKKRKKMLSNDVENFGILINDIAE